MDLTIIFYGLVSIIIAISLHEMMHAYVGYVLGDDTAKAMGRVTVNPLAHIDPLTTVAVPLFLLSVGLPPIAAARPVPFNPSRVKWGEVGAGMIAIAGPLTNLALAFVAAFVFKAIDGAAVDFFATFIAVNVGLFVFNMLPIPPLDGSRVLYVIAPDAVREVMDTLERMGLAVIFVLVVFGGQFLSPLLIWANKGILEILF